MEASVPKPDWLKIKVNYRPEFMEVREILRSLGVKTICDPSHCPNIGDCWSRKSAAFLILGTVCTRECRFCAVEKGSEGDEIDQTEPDRIAEAIAKLGLKQIVITSVTRDDLSDHGSNAYGSVVRSIRGRAPSCRIELLIPDMGGVRENLQTVLLSGPDVLGHNVETVERMTPFVRDRRASYRTSLKVLAMSKELSPRTYTKSSIMVGLGESIEEVFSTMDDLRDVGVDMLTIGQYLRPGSDQIEVSRYVAPSEFAEMKKVAKSKGFGHVSSGPFVRSSYKAEDAYDAVRRID